jgi:hypothetical protein
MLGVNPASLEPIRERANVRDISFRGYLGNVNNY